jgi:hypothetical protein
MSKAATGALPAGALGVDPTGSPVTGSAHAASIRRGVLRHLRARCEPPTAVEMGETHADERPRRGARLGAVAGATRPVPWRRRRGSHRLQKVAIPAAEPFPTAVRVTAFNGKRRWRIHANELESPRLNFAAPTTVLPRMQMVRGTESWIEGGWMNGSVDE